MNTNTTPITLTLDEFTLAVCGKPFANLEPTRTDTLKAALIRAAAASSAHADSGDIGPFNTDAPALDYHAFGLRKSTAVKAVESLGLIATPGTHEGTPVIFLDGFTSGTQSRRTEMAEAFTASLIADKIPATIAYRTAE